MEIRPLKGDQQGRLYTSITSVLVRGVLDTQGDTRDVHPQTLEDKANRVARKTVAICKPGRETTENGKSAIDLAFLPSKTIRK